VFARPSGVLSLKTNLLEVLEDHMCVMYISPIPAGDFEQVSVCVRVCVCVCVCVHARTYICKTRR